MIVLLNRTTTTTKNSSTYSQTTIYSARSTSLPSFRRRSFFQSCPRSQPAPAFARNGHRSRSSSRHRNTNPDKEHLSLTSFIFRSSFTTSVGFMSFCWKALLTLCQSFPSLQANIRVKQLRLHVPDERQAKMKKMKDELTE